MKTYEELLHAMQTGVKVDLERDGRDALGHLPERSSASPKHLRVGVNAAMSDQGGLATLLIAKGIFTIEEYVEAVTAAMEREAMTYENKIGARLA